MQVEGKSQKLLRIHRADNVLIVVRSVKPGDREVIDGHDVVFTQEIAIGHNKSCMRTARADRSLPI